MLLGDLAEQHPVLFETLVIPGIMLVIPESWLLRPSFRMFGMAAEGPVAGVWASLASIHICACTLLAVTFARIHCLCSYMHMVEFSSECVSAPHRHVFVYSSSVYRLGSGLGAAPLLRRVHTEGQLVLPPFL